MTSMRRHHVASTSLRRHVPAGNLPPPPWPPNILNLAPQYSKPSYAYVIRTGGETMLSVALITPPPPPLSLSLSLSLSLHTHAHTRKAFDVDIYIREHRRNCASVLSHKQVSHAARTGSYRKVPKWTPDSLESSANFQIAYGLFAQSIRYIFLASLLKKCWKMAWTFFFSGFTQKRIVWWATGNACFMNLSSRPFNAR